MLVGASHLSPPALGIDSFVSVRWQATSSHDASWVKWVWNAVLLEPNYHGHGFKNCQWCLQFRGMENPCKQGNTATTSDSCVDFPIPTMTHIVLAWPNHGLGIAPQPLSNRSNLFPLESSSTIYCILGKLACTIIDYKCSFRLTILSIVC